jgi:iron complex outermembrane recepter protein
LKPSATEKKEQMTRQILTVLFVVIAIATSSAQSECHYILKGKVKEAHDFAPIVNASVWVKELGMGVSTDENGSFTLQNLCRQTYTLQFSHVECQQHTEQIAVDGNTESEFLLQHGEKLLEKVEVRAKKVELELTQANATVSAEDARATKGQVLGDVLKTLAGVTTLNTGSTISKPVVQGLHSDRVLILNNGVRQEGQQWGLDHAPEVDPFIADRITVVKGAASVKYGVGAIGGVVLVEPRALRDTQGMGGEVNMVFNSNGRMGILSSMLEGKKGGIAWRAQGTAKRGGTLSTPQYLLSNTGVEELNGSLMLGFALKNAKFELFYSHFYTKIGILKDSHIGNLTDLKDAIERGNPLSISAFSYDIERPAQRISHDIFKTKVTIPTGEAGRLTMMGYYQHNLREEYDAHKPGGVKPFGFDRSEIAFQLPTIGGRADWEHRAWGNWHGGGGLEAIYQSNNTFAGALIPDYQQTTTGVYWSERWRRYPQPFEIEGALRYDVRRLAVDSTRFGDRDKVFTFNNLSVSSGFIYHLNSKGKVALNVGTAWRSPNVNELFSRGVHHGTASYEQGNSDLMPELALNTSLSFHYDHAIFEAEITAFQNVISDFIFQKPDSLPVLTIRGAFPAFSYAQTDAILRGGDLLLMLKPIRHFFLKIKGSTLFAKNRKNKEWLPLMPTDRLELSLGTDNQSFKYVKKGYANIGLALARQQTRTPLSISDYQAPPAGYARVDATIGGNVHLGKRILETTLRVENVFNTAYREYLDRLRYFALSVGRNVSLKVRMSF